MVVVRKENVDSLDLDAGKENIGLSSPIES